MSPDRPSKRVATGPAGRFHPVPFYGFAIAIAWTAWTPLILHTLRGVDLPVPYPVALFICQTIGAFSPLVALFLIQRIKGESGLVEGVFQSFMEMLGHSLMIDRVFLLSGGNLLVEMPYHQGVTTSFMFFEGNTNALPGVVVLLGIALIVRAVAHRRRHRRPRTSFA